MRVSTEGLRPKDQLDFWRDFHASISNVEPTDPRQHGYRASVEMCNLGSAQLVTFDMDPVHFERTPDHVKHSDLNTWVLAVMKKGSVNTEAFGRHVDAPTGTVHTQSFARPFSGIMGAATFSGLCINPDDFGEIASEIDKATHQVLRGSMSKILGEFIVTLETYAKALTVDEISAVDEVFRQLLKAALSNNKDGFEQAKRPASAIQYDLARRFIDANLNSPALTPESICAQLGLSRRHLYYLFEKQGGVASYIRKRRLAACYKTFRNQSEKKLISSVAYQYGFTNLSSFNRQFLAQYGFRPSEARSAWLSGLRFDTVQADTFADWLGRLD